MHSPAASPSPFRSRLAESVAGSSAVLSVERTAGKGLSFALSQFCESPRISLDPLLQLPLKLLKKSSGRVCMA
jgi:hypothetical protein